jgi:hypothetical protein
MRTSYHQSCEESRRHVTSVRSSRAFLLNESYDPATDGDFYSNVDHSPEGETVQCWEPEDLFEDIIPLIVHFSGWLSRIN